MPPQAADITGVVLCGGRGSRMGGVDKGLQLLDGQPLALQAARRLAPQVGTVLLNANRHLGTYRAFGWPVLTDTLPDQPGPLAGWLAALAQCRTPWLASVPCDTPHFPADLVQRLAGALDGADVATACTVDAGVVRAQPVFALLRAELAGSLAAALAAGQRQVQRWVAAQRAVQVVFDDAAAFRNANTLQDLQDLQRDPPRG